jgi:hypothetical protein
MRGITIGTNTFGLNGTDEKIPASLGSRAFYLEILPD